MRRPGREPMICNVPRALARMGGNVRLLKQVAAYVGEDFPSYIAQLRAAVEQGDCKKAQILAHGIKGMAVNFDGEAASRAAVEIQELAQKGELNGAREALEELRREFDRLLAMLTCELAKL